LAQSRRLDKDLSSNFTMDGHRLFYTSPVNDAELLAVMLEKHDIAAKEKVIEPMPDGEDEFSRPVEVWVPEADYDRAYQLFFGDSEDEL
tara:strand:- start:110 stop:376 length:267 start_codon:yes stop_codon:yes gene_type:complete